MAGPAAASWRESSGSCPYAPPSFHVAQPYELTLAGTAADVARAAGIRLQDWQADVLADWAACDASGQFVHRRCLASIPRQAGKSVLAIAWVATLVLNGYHVLWTCHNYSTTCEMRRRFADIFGRRPGDRFAGRPEFNAYMTHANNNTGQEAFEFSTGGVLAFSTRTASAALGYTFDVVVYDEAQELTDEHQQAILPTTTSGPMRNPQTIYTGTPRRPGRPGNVFARERGSVMSGADPEADYCMWEWGVGEVGDVRDESRWAAANPSIGRVANVAAIRMALPPTMTELAFAQEYLGYWLPGNAGEPPEIAPAAWDALAVPAPPREGRAVAAFKFAPDGSEGGRAACRRPEGGRPHVECLAIRSLAGGLQWFVDFAAARIGSYAGFVVDGGGVAAEMCERMRAAGVPSRAIARPTTAQVCAACAGLLADVAEGGFTHYAQPELDRSAKNARKRPIGRSGFGFEGIAGADPLPLEACALALWGIDEIKRNPGRRGRVG